MTSMPSFFLDRSDPTIVLPARIPFHRLRCTRYRDFWLDFCLRINIHLDLCALRTHLSCIRVDVRWPVSHFLHRDRGHASIPYPFWLVPSSAFCHPGLSVQQSGR